MIKCTYCNNEIFMITTMQEIYRYKNEDNVWFKVDEVFKGNQYVCNTCLKAFDKTQIK